MHNAAFKELGMDAEYRLFEVRPQDLEGFLSGALTLKDTKGGTFSSAEIKHFNITIPHKVRAFELRPANATVRFDPQGVALLCGAVNTAKREGGCLEYRNTDSAGFIKSLQHDLGFDTEGKCVLVLGAGGAGRAVVAGLSIKGARAKKVYVYDASAQASKATQAHFERNAALMAGAPEFITAAEIGEKVREAQLLVNASPVGMKEGDPSPIERSLLHRGLAVYDVVYNRSTELIRDAMALGLPAAGGKGMLLYQGAEAFEFWTGKKAPLEVMRQALESSLQSPQ